MAARIVSVREKNLSSDMNLFDDDKDTDKIRLSD
jgi:hypothetical protein